MNKSIQLLLTITTIALLTASTQAQCTSSNCKTCSSGSTTNCSICNEQYFVKDNQCKKCPDNCKTCFNDTLCITCMDDKTPETDLTCERTGFMFYLIITLVALVIAGAILAWYFVSHEKAMIRKYGNGMGGNRNMNRNMGYGQQ